MCSEEKSPDLWWVRALLRLRTQVANITGTPYTAIMQTPISLRNRNEDELIPVEIFHDTYLPVTAFDGAVAVETPDWLADQGYTICLLANGDTCLVWTTDFDWNTPYATEYETVTEDETSADQKA